MKEETRTLGNILKGLPEILRMEQTWGLLYCLIRQTGIENMIPILLGTMRKMGLIKTVTDLLSFKLGDFLANFFLSEWDVFEDLEAVVIPISKVNDVEKRKAWTHRELKDRVLRAANALQGLGVTPKDKILLMMPSKNEFYELFLACTLIGSAAPVANYHLRKEELIASINKVPAKVMIFDEEFLDTVNLMKNQLHNIEHFIMVGENPPENMLSYEDLLSKSSNKSPKFNFKVAFNPFTGGTTGVPKSVNYDEFWGYVIGDVIKEGPREKAPFIEYLKYTMMQFSCTYWWGIADARDPVTKHLRSLQVAPSYHSATVHSYLYPVFFGGTWVALKKFDAEEMLRIIEEERITYVSVVPAMLQRILDLPDEVKRRYDLSSMWTIVCVGAPCPPEVKKGINELFTQQGAKRPVYNEFWGSTEGGPIAILTSKDPIENPKRYESTGRTDRCAYIKCLDEEGNVCPPNKVGKLYLRSLSMLGLRYVGDTDEKVRSNIRVIDGKDYFYDGMDGYIDEDGFVYLTGREKNLIIPGGVNIYPDEIEGLILRYPKVAACAAIPIPDKDLGEVVGVVVQLKEGESATEEEIIEYCKKEGLYGYKVPRKVDFWKKIPVADDGKLLKRDILPKYWDEKGVKRRG